MRRRYAVAGPVYKGKLIDEAVELFGYHRKAAIRALNRSGEAAVLGCPFVRGRPKEYDPEKLLKPLRTIWLTAMQPCGKRLASALSIWVPAYEEYHCKLDSDIRESLLRASAATLDRLLRPLRVEHRRRARTRPGTLLRQEIPIRTQWQDEGPGYLEMDTVAMCGRSLDDRHGWMFDGVDIRTTWSELRAMANRSQSATLEQLADVEQSLPFPLAGLDADNGGEFINHHLVAYAHNRPRPLAFTRSRPYHKNDNAHVEQKNYTQVRLWFGYERHDNPEVVPVINQLCKGALGQFLNFYLPTMKLQRKRREGSAIRREYDRPATPLQRVLRCPEVPQQNRKRLLELSKSLNPFQLRSQINKELKRIDEIRELRT